MPTQSLSELNSFKLGVNANRLVEVSQLKTLESLLPIELPYLVLGGGSNILFTQDYDGVVLHNQLKGISVTDDQDAYYLQVAGGENWHDLVMYCAQRGIGGLENLALIPGTVGAAPVQNIGAYGVEFCQLCLKVQAIDLQTKEHRQFTALQCEFGYRESLFKTQRQYFITGVQLKLPKQWQPTLDYGELKAWAAQLDSVPTSLQVADKVIEVRQAKLPDPNVIPNVGSFFKNPLVSRDLAASLADKFPLMPQYHLASDVKLAAGWLIDQLGLKDHTIGGAAVHARQALVLVNKNNATPNDVVELAAFIRTQVSQHFGVTLEPEVNFIDKHGYSFLDKVLKNV